jgi:hypothetical protein
MVYRRWCNGRPDRRYLDEMFDRLAGTGAGGRRALAEAEDHLRAGAEEGVTNGLTPEEAQRAAVARFGPSDRIATAFRLSHAGLGHRQQGCSPRSPSQSSESAACCCSVPPSSAPCSVRATALAPTSRPAWSPERWRSPSPAGHSCAPEANGRPKQDARTQQGRQDATGTAGRNRDTQDATGTQGPHGRRTTKRPPDGRPADQA